jgi:hypothetical protein
MPAQLFRRDLLRYAAAAGAACMLPSCTRALSSSAALRSAGSARPVELHAFFDLPLEDPRSRELSGLAWDERRRKLWAVQDESSTIVAIVPSHDLRQWRFAETITVDAGGPVDLEGIVLLDDGFIVCSEDGPRIVEVDLRGRFRREVALPSRLSNARSNRSLESLTASPSGRYLFTTTEAALTCDGEKASLDAGTRVRVFRMERHGSLESEHVYATDPAPYAVGDWGVSDLAAISDDELLVLERGWAKGHGNTARIYRTRIDPRACSTTLDRLPENAHTLGKDLQCDLGLLACPGVPPPKQPQASPLLDNYEGLTLGPRLPDGRGSLILVSDDNGHDNQFARIVVLAV